MTDKESSVTGGPDQPTHIPADLFEKFYGELRSLARRYMAGERANHTLQPTALVHEAYLRLVASEPVLISNRVHFLRLISRTMRRILVDHGRHKAATREGGGLIRISLSDVSLANTPTYDFIDFEEALKRLEATRSQRQAAIIELRYLVGLTVDEVAEVLGISARTVKGDSRVGMAWIRRYLES